MGETVSNISRSSCCGADYPIDRELHTQSAIEHKGINPNSQAEYCDPYDTNSANINGTEQHHIERNKLDELMEEQNKYKLQISKLEEQLDRYKVREKKQNDEYNEYKQENLKLSDTKNELIHATTKLNEIIDKYKQSETSETDIEMTPSYADIVKLTNEIKKTQNNKGMDEEIKSLNNKLQLVIQELEQQREKQSLKQQLNEDNEKSIQSAPVNTETVIQNTDTVNTETGIQKQLSHTPDTPQPTEVVYLETKGNNDIDTPSLEPKAQSIHEVKSADKIQSMQRLTATLESASSRKDAKQLRGIILKQYKTMGFEDDDLSEDEDFEVQEEHEDRSRESSLGPEEQMAIAEAKAEQNREKDIEDEAVAMRKELRAMKKVMTPKDMDNMKKQSVSNFETDSMEKSVSSSEEHSLKQQSSRLYRAASHWEPEDVVKEKREMQAQMEALMQSHIESNVILTEYLSE